MLFKLVENKNVKNFCYLDSLLCSWRRSKRRYRNQRWQKSNDWSRCWAWLLVAPTSCYGSLPTRYKSRCNPGTRCRGGGIQEAGAMVLLSFSLPRPVFVLDSARFDPQLAWWILGGPACCNRGKIRKSFGSCFFKLLYVKVIWYLFHTATLTKQSSNYCSVIEVIAVSLSVQLYIWPNLKFKRP